METWWYPFHLSDHLRGWYFVPFWMPIVLAGMAWLLLVRPDRHLLARRRAQELQTRFSGRAPNSQQNSECRMSAFVSSP